MTQTPLPEPEEFAEAACLKMAAGRKWAWLSRETGIDAGTLKNQLVKNPASLKLRTARKVASALDLTIWGEAAA